MKAMLRRSLLRSTQNNPLSVLHFEIEPLEGKTYELKTESQKELTIFSLQKRLCAVEGFLKSRCPENAHSSRCPTSEILKIRRFCVSCIASAI